MKAQIDWIPLAHGRRAADPGQDAGGDAGLRRLAVVQRGEPAARARPLDAHDHHSQPVLGRQGLREFDDDGTDEAVGLLRPGRRRHGGTGEIHAAHARSFVVPDGPIITEGNRGEARATHAPGRSDLGWLDCAGESVRFVVARPQAHFCNQKTVVGEDQGRGRRQDLVPR